MAFVAAIPALVSAFAASAATTAAVATPAVAGSLGGLAIGASAPALTAIGTTAATISDIGIGASAISGAVGAYGALSSANAQKNAAQYNAQVSAQNAAQASQNSQIASQSGAQQAGMSSLKSKAAVGALIANTAAGNIDVNQGSAVATKESEQQLGELDALTIRSNATRQAFSYETQATSDTAESQLKDYEAKQDVTAGDIGAASTFIGQEGSAASNWARFQLNSGSNLGTG